MRIQTGKSTSLPNLSVPLPVNGGHYIVDVQNLASAIQAKPTTNSRELDMFFSVIAILPALVIANKAVLLLPFYVPSHAFLTGITQALSFASNAHNFVKKKIAPEQEGQTATKFKTILAQFLGILAATPSACAGWGLGVIRGILQGVYETMKEGIKIGVSVHEDIKNHCIKNANNFNTFLTSMNKDNKYTTSRNAPCVII